MNIFYRMSISDYVPDFIGFNLWRVYTFIHKIQRGISNLIKWFPIIWRDRDYDHLFLTKLLEAKIKFMRDSFAKAKYYEGWERDVQNMDEALKYLAAMHDLDYEDPEGFRSDLFRLLEKELSHWWW